MVLARSRRRQREQQGLVLREVWVGVVSVEEEEGEGCSILAGVLLLVVVG